MRKKILVQDKKAEIKLALHEIESNAWEDSPQHVRSRTKQIEFINKLLSIDSNHIFLDAGCGPGNYGIIMAKYHSVVGTDLSPDFLKKAIERSKMRNVQFPVIAGDLEMLPYADNVFDVTFCAFTLHHFPDINNPVRELIRVTKPGGMIVVLDLNGSNLIVKLSERLERLIEYWLVKKGLDTPNETHHTPKECRQILTKYGVGEVRIYSHYFGGLPPMRPHPTFTMWLLYIAVRVRSLMYYISSKLLPSPFGGADILVMGKKKHTQQ